MAEIDLGVTIVCDAGPLIHLDELRCQDLLAEFPVVVVPDAVWHEVERHRPRAFEEHRVRLRRVPLSGPLDGEIKAVIRAFALDAGEQAALLYLRRHPEAVLLTDDAAARLAAHSLGYRAHGTLGILLRSIRRGQRTREQVLAILADLPRKSTLHLRPDLLQRVVEEVEDSAEAD